MKSGTLNLLKATAVAVALASTHGAHASLLNHYTFDGNANDSQGLSDGTVVNDVTLTQDRFGNANSAYHFAGSDDYINVGNPQLNDWTDDYSFSAWIRPESPPATTWPTIISKWSGINHYETFWFGLDQAGDGLGGERTDTGNHYRETAVVINQWQHVALTYDHSETTLALYVGGQLLESWNDFSGGVLNNNIGNDIIIGAVKRGSVVHEFKGDIDDLRIYSTALSADEVSSEAGVPEPTTLALLGLALAGLGFRAKRKKLN